MTKQELFKQLESVDNDSQIQILISAEEPYEIKQVIPEDGTVYLLAATD